MKWVPQAQFAGYYVAQAKGYYKAEGLDVTIKPGDRLAQGIVLPAPSVILNAIIEFWPAIWKNSLQTLYTTTVGFILAVVFGLGLGIAIGWSRKARNGAKSVWRRTAIAASTTGRKSHDSSCISAVSYERCIACRIESVVIRLPWKS